VALDERVDRVRALERMRVKVHAEARELRHVGAPLGNQFALLGHDG